MMNAIPFQVLYEDNHLIIMNKEPGEIVQADKSGDPCMMDRVKEYIKVKYGKPGAVYLGLVHRIDRPVSGAVIFARTSKALERMNQLVKERQIVKTYWALVEERPNLENGTLIHFIKKNEKQNKSYIHDHEVKESKRAELSYKVIGASKHYTLLEVNLMTGRHHQIRAQLSHIGCPIRGDLKYGAARSNDNGSIHLHARKLEFQHPVSKEMLRITAPLPNDNLWNLFADVEA
jgi:23S rRNA pseudouridine1911/1915/1917 synthase